MFPEFFTIGVYGYSVEQFFEKLVANEIDTFIDIRRRRAVRGSKFSFVNSNRLQSKLRELGIKYLHILELAPTNDIRDLQKKDDEKLGTAKRDRSFLGNIFIKEYEEKILNHFDLNILLQNLSNINSKKVVLFCVEHEPTACHRSIVAEKLKKEYHVNTFDIK